MRIISKMLVVTIFCGVLLLACSQCENKDKRAQSQTPKSRVQNRLSCGPDSQTIVFFLNKIHKASLKAELFVFYKNRNYTDAWVNSNGVNENAGNFINLLNKENALNLNDNDSSRGILEKLYREVIADHTRLSCDQLKTHELEVLLSSSFFEFAKRNWQGANDDILKQVNWYIARKQIDYAQFLSNYLNAKGEPSLNEPVYRQYGLLKKMLGKYNEIALKGGWQPIPGEYTIIKKGDSWPAVVLIKRQLYLTGDLAEADSNCVFDGKLENAVKQFQERHGLAIDGIIGQTTLQAMRVKVQDRIYQILINMERCKWVPVQVTGDYLVVNIPEFRLHVYESNELEWSCNAIVGKSDPLDNTVIFNDSIEFVVFNPYWNIPNNIVVNETIPAIKKDSAYLQKNDLEIVDKNGHMVEPTSINWHNFGQHFPFIIRQKPGKHNSLGLVKFLFPNPHDIYMHDTPARSLFNESSRLFSHGCIRLEEPFKLAQFLLRGDKTWTAERINSILLEGQETFVRLKKKVPVFIAYFTCWVNKENKLNFREDVYGHDARMKKLLFTN